jgi:hypothetical protein
LRVLKFCLRIKRASGTDNATSRKIAFAWSRHSAPVSADARKTPNAIAGAPTTGAIGMATKRNFAIT